MAVRKLNPDGHFLFVRSSESQPQPYSRMMRMRGVIMQPYSRKIRLRRGWNAACVILRSRDLKVQQPFQSPSSTDRRDRVEGDIARAA